MHEKLTQSAKMNTEHCGIKTWHSDRSADAKWWQKYIVNFVFNSREAGCMGGRQMTIFCLLCGRTDTYNYMIYDKWPFNLFSVLIRIHLFLSTQLDWNIPLLCLCCVGCRFKVHPSHRHVLHTKRSVALATVEIAPTICKEKNRKSLMMELQKLTRAI